MRLTSRLSPCRIALVAGLVVAAYAYQPSARADEPTEADRAAIEALGRQIVARLDTWEEYRNARDEAEFAAKRARSALGQAEKNRTVAEITVKEYQEGSYPQDRQTILGEIKIAESEFVRTEDRLAWSLKMLDKHLVQDSQALADRMSQQKAEIELSNANKKLELLEKFTRVKQTTELEANVKKCELAELRKREEQQAADKALVAADRALEIEKLIPSESLAIARLDEAIGLFDESKGEAAGTKLGEARTLWSEAQAARARARYEALKDRIRAEAKRSREK